MKETKPIDHVPTENLADVCAEARDFILAHAFMGLQPGHNVEQLLKYDGGHLYLMLGGHVRDPDNVPYQSLVESTLVVRWIDGADMYEDPDGTWWHVGTLSTQVGWSSSGNTGVRVARQRCTLNDATVTLGEMFNEHFASLKVWTKSTTRAERAEWARELHRNSTILKIHAAIKEAIHTTCRGMRVGTERFLDRPDNALADTYEITLEHKEYRATVPTREGAEMLFVRTK